MSYTLSGTIRTSDADPIIEDINRFDVRLLGTSRYGIVEEGYPIITFEAQVSTTADKTALFEMLKLHVDEHSGYVDYAAEGQIIESYRRG